MESERDYILFYCSFHEAIRCMPDDVQLELYRGMLDYWFYNQEPQHLQPVSKGMFALMKPLIDRNRTRVENGKKGGRKAKSKKESYNLSFSQEVDAMKADQPFCEAICQEFSLTPDTLAIRFKDFLDYCSDTRPSKPHESIDDARSHFRLWNRRIHAKQAMAPVPVTYDTPTDYTYDGGFGGQDV